MSVQNKFVNVNADFVKEYITIAFPVAPTASQTNLPYFSIVPGYKFQVVGYRIAGISFTTVTNVNLYIGPTMYTITGATSVLTAALIPVNAADTPGTLVTTTGTLRGGKTSSLIFTYTTGVGPASSHATVTAIIRPCPLDGEVG